MLLRFNASTTALPFVVSPASISTVLPAGEEIRIASPLIGPTSRMRIVSSPPDAGGGCVRHHGSTYFQPTKAPARATARRTAIAQPQPRVARPNQKSSPEISSTPRRGGAKKDVITAPLCRHVRKLFLQLQLHARAPRASPLHA